MLQFIYGKPASGKTYTALNILKNISEQGKEAALIVPEQFTFESERAVLKVLGDKAAINTSVFSFTRLCDEVGRNVGSIAGITLGDGDKVIFMKRAITNVGSELKLWSRYANSISFAKTILDTIGEFKINAISPNEIKAVADSSESDILKSKLYDLALIYEEYNTLVGEKFLDPADRLSKLYNSLGTFRFFEGKTVILDSFKGFTGQQYKIIERIISQADDIYVCLTNNPDNKKEFNLFYNIRTCAEKIEKIAAKYSVKSANPIIFKESHYSNPNLSNLERLVSGETLKSIDTERNCITVCNAENAYDEAEFAARTIRRLVRVENYRYRDFVIIARDSDSYTEAVASACKRNEISVFYDKRLPLASFPIAVAIDAAINAFDFSTENILKFHKTGLGSLTTEEIALLQNYTYLWNIEGNVWLEEWSMNPKGFNSEELNEDALQELKLINQLRVRAITELSNFKNNFKLNAQQMSRAIIGLFKECNFADKLVLMCESFKAGEDTATPDVLRQAYDEYINILDSLVRCFGEKSISATEYYEALTLAVSLASVGVIPQMLDEVTFGSADRIRPSRPKIAFILGANQGVFPKTVANTGVFNLLERRSLLEKGLEISDNSVYSAIDEEFLVYCNLCCPSDGIYISYSRQTVGGDSLEPSAFVQNILDNLSCDTVREPTEQLLPLSAPETSLSAFSEYCRRRRSADDTTTINQALKDTAMAEKLSFIEDFLTEKPKSLTEETAKKLFGKDIYMSASKFDNFNRCRFSYFCRYGLGAKKLQPAEFDVMQRGTIVHYVLECLIEEYKDNISALTETELEELTDRYINDYLDSVSGYRKIETARLKFLVSRLARSLKDVVKHIAAELSQSSFKPVACELKIGKNGDVPPVKFPYDGGNIVINGSIDRVDKYNGYIRIIDYKTGNKTFKLPDVLFGLNLQMLIYLYAVTRASGLEDAKAAAILYQPSNRDLNDNGMAMNGLLQSDTLLVSAMDKECNGQFVPKLTFNKDGSLSKRCTSFISEAEFSEIFNHIEKLMKRAGNKIASGDIKIEPLDGRESKACKYCDFASVCGIEGREAPRVPDIDNESVFKLMREEEEYAL